jgi:Tol biopolymer transport system component
MNKWFGLLIAALLVAGLQPTAARQISAQGEKLLAGAQHKATVDGDLKGAIEDYRKIVAGAGADRALAAQALLQMADCYQKLGDAESSKIYERVLREYADQAEAASVARAKLGRIKSAAGETGIVTRQVWTGPKVDFRPGTVSADGRFITYTDWSTGSLALHDFTGGTDRQLVGGNLTSAEFAQESTISPDGRQVAYLWRSKGGQWDLRVLGIDKTGSATPRVLHAQDAIATIAPYAWSPDGRWIAVQIRRKDQTAHIGLVNTGDGAFRVLRSTDGRLSTTGLFFSPDGKRLAYDLRSSDMFENRDVFVLAVDGSGEIPAVVHPANDVAIGWTPDGRHLLFSSDRGGSKGLWALPWADGGPAGEPALVKTDINLETTLGVTRAGALYYGVTLSSRDVFVAEIDPHTGAILSPPSRPIEQSIGANASPDWSPDGRSLAYISGGSVLAIRSMDSGQTRELRPALSPIFSPRWAPDGRSFAVDGRDDKGRRGIYRIDAQTGTTSLIVQVPPNLGLYGLAWLPDGRKVVYRENNPEAFRVIEHDIPSGSQRELLRGNVLTMSLSSDGRHLAYSTSPPWRLMVLSLDGGPPREVRIEGMEPAPIMVIAWTPDSRAILFRSSTPNSGSGGLWLISPDGGQPRKVGLNVDIIPLTRFFNPRTNQVAFAADTSRREVWVMEHFLPALKAPAARRQDQ